MSATSSFGLYDVHISTASVFHPLCISADFPPELVNHAGSPGARIATSVCVVKEGNRLYLDTTLPCGSSA